MTLHTDEGQVKMPIRQDLERVCVQSHRRSLTSVLGFYGASVVGLIHQNQPFLLFSESNGEGKILTC